MKELNDDDLIRIYNLVFKEAHSDIFKIAKISDLLFDEPHKVERIILDNIDRKRKEQST